MPSRELTEKLQGLEEKVELVLTCIKSSVYSVFMENPEKFRVESAQDEDVSMAD